MQSTFLLLSTLLVKLISGATSANPDSSEGTILYVNSPACGSFRCTVDWKQGSKVSVNWINPPSGDVSIALASNIGGAVYPIVSSTPATSSMGQCDSGNGFGVAVSGVQCGGVQFLVPGGWVAAVNYTIVVTSLDNPSIVGYTDAVTIISASGAPSGIIPTLLTSSPSTSTNAGSLPTATGSSGSGSDSNSNSSASSIMITSTKPVATMTGNSSTSPTSLSLNVSAAMASSTSAKTAGGEGRIGERKSWMVGAIVGLMGVYLIV